MKGSQQSAARRLLSILWAAVAAGVILLTVAWYVFIRNEVEIRESLSRLSVIGLEIACLVLLLGLICDASYWYKQIAALSRNTKIILAAVLVVAFLLVFFVAPRTNRIYYDEHIYQNIAQSITFTGKAFLCNECEAAHGSYNVFASEYNKQPSAFPFFLAMAFRLFGVSETVAHLANISAFLIGVLGIFLLGFKLFHSERAGLFSAALLASTPMFVTWSATVAAEPAAATFSIVALLLATRYVEGPRIASALAFAGSLALAAQFRPESVLIALPVFLIIIVNAPSSFKKPSFYWLGVAVLLLFSPLLIHFYAVHFR